VVSEVSEHRADGPLPAHGRHLLEASAGTGKTYALAALVARLVAERDVPVDQLLVVTFTRAAAAELRDRIRRRLVQAARALPRPPADCDDVVLLALADADADEVARRAERLERAVVDFDTATITTIHGFCQQVLQALGATSGHNPDAVLVQDTSDLVHGACADVLADAALTGEPTFTRDSLVSTVRTVLNNPGVEVVAGSGSATDDARRDLVLRAAAAVRERLGSTGTLSYDGMLEAVRAALVAHPDAASRVAQQFPVALVDEFQDTDPVQWDILRAVYTADGGPRPGTRLVLVGDPKQAIYAFRGGDIHTYLAAAAGATTSTLPVNWRSDGALLDALNGLGRGWRLGADLIEYREVRPAPDHAARRLTDAAGAPLAALEVRCAAAGLDMTKPTSKGKRNVPADPARWACIDDVVRSIVELLDGGARIPCPDDEADGRGGPGTRSLRAGDVAVLVHANRWAHPVQRALVRAGVPAIVTGGSSVAESPAADQWRILLDALARPSDPTRARAVALSWLGDGDAGWVAASASDEGDDLRLAELQAQLDAWSALLRSDGVSALLSALRVEVRLAASVLGLPGGERDLTDFEHLGELLHRATAGKPVGPESVRAVLDEMAKGGAEDDPEAIKRRIDTDAPAVRIMTLHAAKGLEFPVVCCPSLWNLGSGRVTDRRLYHAAGEGRRLDVCAKGGDVKEAEALAKAELAGQDARLTYVGMTRAVHRLVIWWAAGRDAHKAPIAPLLFGDVGPAPDPDDHAGQILDRLDGLGIGHVTGLVEVPPHGRAPTAAGRTPAEALVPPDGAAPLAVAALGRRIDRSAGRWSFTAIASRAVHQEVASVTDEVVPAPVRGDPDDPSLGDAADGDEHETVPPVLFDGLGAGAAFGTLVHDAMEHLDFTDDLEAQLSSFLASRPWAGEAPRRAALARAIAATVRTPLGQPFADLRLSSLDRSDRLDELDFELPLATSAERTGSGRRTVDTRAIGGVLLDHMGPDDPLVPWAGHLADGSISVDIGGHLTGSIDLVFRQPADVPGGHRFSVVDYKTNRLGIWAVPDEIGNYHPERLPAAMADHHYPLQAVLYSVALHRYLRWRLAGYRPELHLGPVGYLFVRGMVGDATPVAPGGRRHGVFDWTIPGAAVAELSDLLDGVTARRAS
jgi:exodeoxyribonuclease V beta subunit